MPYVKAPTPQSNTGAPGILDVYRSNNVFVNNVPVSLWDSAQSSQAASQAQILSPTFVADQAIVTIDGGESPRFVEAKQREYISQGIINASDLNVIGRIKVGNIDIDSAIPVPPVFNTSTVNLSQTEFPDDYQLSPNYTLGQMTKQPNVMFEYQVQPSMGLTTAEVVENLEFLTNNCVEPIRSQYSNMFVTNSFRTADPGSTSQHPKGQACDMQFSGISKSDYYTIAQWIKNNVSYDQLLLEYKTTGSKLPWIHISYNKNGNRGQVKTFLNNKVYHSSGLVDLANTE